MSVLLSLTQRAISASTSGSSALTGEIPRLSSGIFQKLRGLGRCIPMTNLFGRPVFLSRASATTAAITAPTNPIPTTTTTSRPCCRCARASCSSRTNSS